MPAIGFIAHMDTSPDFCGENVSPRIIENYDGEDVVLSGRSLGEINVQVILEALGGGGNSTVAGGRVKDSDPVTVRERLLEAIGDYLEK